MRIIKFNPYTRFKDEELIRKFFDETENLKYLVSLVCEEDYRDGIMRVNNLIIEIKRRNLKADKRESMMKIIKK